jgi:hypothetical protein
MARTLDPKTAVDPVAVLVRQYRLAITKIARRLAAGELLPDSYLARQIPFILRELGKLDVFAKRWAARQIAAAYKAGARAAQVELARAGMAGRTSAFSGFDSAAAAAMVARTSANLSNVVTALVQGLLGGERPTTAQAVRLMREALAGDNRLVNVVGRGLSVRVPSGRYWDAAKYARMEGVTATNDSLRVARRSRYLQHGVDVVVVTSTGSSHEPCIRWEGRQLSLTGATPGLPTPADARADGLWHPNCQHSYVVDSSAEQPGGDLVQEEEPNFPTLGERPSRIRRPLRSRLRSRISEILAQS